MTNLFASATTQRELDRAIRDTKLNAAGWIELAKAATGMSCRSGRDARNAVHTHYSNQILLAERVASVRKAFK